MRLLLLLVFASCATTGTGRTSNSSQSNSSAAGGSSDGSAKSSNNSTASSDNSNQSSKASSDGSRNSSNSNESSKNSTNATTDSPSAANSSQIAVGSALLTAVAGGIVTTVYALKWRRQAKLQEKQLRQLQQAPPPSAPPLPSSPNEFESFPPAGDKKTEVEEEPSFEAMVQARAWLLANELQLKQDLALGAGATLDELAGLAGIALEHRVRFARLLQQHRDELRVPRDVTPKQAANVMSRVGELVMLDPILHLDGEALVASW